MTVSNYTPLSITPGAGSVLAPIAIPSPFYNDSDIKVYFVDSRPNAVTTETLLIKDTNYTMTKAGLAGTKPRSYTGTISVIAAVPASCSIAVMIDPVNAQTSDLSAVPFSPMEYEQGFDLSVMRDAALRELVKRSVRSSLSSTTALGIVFPVPAALRVIGWNEYGNLENFDVSQLVTLAGAATAEQGEKADTALQPSDIGDAPGSVAAGDDSRIVKAVQFTLSPGDTNIEVQDAIESVSSGSEILIRIPRGAYDLAATPLPNGRVVSFSIDPGSVFTGAGALPVNTSPTFYNPVGENIHINLVKGSPSSPLTGEKDPILLLSKHTAIDPSALPSINACAVFLHGKYTSGENSSVLGIFSEAYDTAGWDQTGPISFVEGARFHGTTGGFGDQWGSPYGQVTVAAVLNGANFKTAIGIEAEVILDGHTNQPGWQNFNPGNRIAASYNATSLGSGIDAYYITNPFIGSGEGAATGYAVTNDSVWDRGFASNAVCHVGLDLSLGSYDQGAVMLPNNQDIKARNAAGTAYNSLIALDNNDRVAIGLGTSQIILGTGVYLNGGMNFDGNLIPATDNSRDVGASGYRIRNYYGATNAIVTSDARLKVVRGEVEASERAVARSVPIKVFRYKDAMQEKGNEARLHVGVTAQDLVAAFEAQGLDPWRYGVVGKDLETKQVRKTRVVSVPVMEGYEEDYTDYVEVDGVFVQTALKRRAERAVTKTLPVVDENGEPVMCKAPVKDEDGHQLFDEVEIKDEYGNTRKTKIKRTISMQMQRTVVVTEQVEEEFFEDEATGKDVLSVRYEQLALFMIAALRVS